MFGIKDLDLYLGKFCNNNDIISLSHVNSSCLKRYDDRYFKQRFLQRYGQRTLPPDNYGKKDYCEDITYLNDFDSCSWDQNWESVVEKDKVYLIPLVNFVDNFKVIEHAVKFDAIECFKDFFAVYRTYLIPVAIEHNSIKILNYLENINQMHYIESYVMDALQYGCTLYVSVIPPVEITREWVENLCYQLCYNYKNLVVLWAENYNEALHMLLKMIPLEMLNDIRQMSLARDCHHVIKMIIQYKSKFGSFYSK